MNARGQYGAPRAQLRGSPREVVGISLFHTVGDRERAMDAINTDVRQLQNEVMAKAGYSADPYREASGPLWEWWKLAGIPIIEEWQKFYADMWDSYMSRWASSWETYENWQQRIKKLRGLTEARLREGGDRLETPSPEDLPTTVWADVTHTVKKGAGDIWSGAGDVWSLVKYGAWAVLGIGAIVALSSVASNLKSGKDPAEKYVTLIKPRSARELPSSPRLALPAGEPVEVA